MNEWCVTTAWALSLGFAYILLFFMETYSSYQDPNVRLSRREVERSGSVSGFLYWSQFPMWPHWASFFTAILYYLLFNRPLPCWLLSVVGYCWLVIRYGLKFSNSGIIWRANINSQLLIDINHQGSKGRLLRMTRTSWDSLHGYDQNEDRYIDNKGFANEVSGINEEYSNEW